MKRPSKLRLALLTLALAGACLTPANSKADYYGWGWGGYYAPSYGYYPGYTTGYFPNYWDGYYSGGGVYTAGYYPGSWSSYYSPSCGGCGSCGWSGCGSCSYGCGSCGSSCGSCGIGCGSCGSGCGSCGYGSCGSSCCGSGLACGSCGGGCGSCGSGCGAVSGSDCGGSAPSKPGKSPPPADDEKFTPRPSPTYDDTPPPRSKRKAPENSPAGSATGTGLEAPGGDTTGPTKGTDDAQGAKPATNDGYKRPITKPPAGGAAPGEQPFGTNKPIGPAPDQSVKKKAPMPNVPGADAAEAAPSGTTASSQGEPDVFTSNPALALQERPTWSYSGSVPKGQAATAVRLASIGSPVPHRIKSPVVESPVRLVENVVRN
jgi:hypothetical protein